MKILLAIFLLTLPGAARAHDLLQCAEMGVLPFTHDFKETAQFLYDNLECLRYLLPPDATGLGVVVAGGEALKIANGKYHLYTSKLQCANLAGNTVAQALLSSGFGRVFNAIDPNAEFYLEEAASAGVNIGISQIPVIGEYLPCLCGFSVTNFSFDNPREVFGQYSQAIQACTIATPAALAEGSGVE